MHDVRRQLADDSEILNFLIKYVGKFDIYVEDDYAAFVRYCFEDPLDAEIFRSRFEPKAERFTGSNAAAANAMLKRDYRAPFTVPQIA